MTASLLGMVGKTTLEKSKTAFINQMMTTLPNTTPATTPTQKKMLKSRDTLTQLRKVLGHLPSIPHTKTLTATNPILIVKHQTVMIMLTLITILRRLTRAKREEAIHLEDLLVEEHHPLQITGLIT